MERSHCQPQHEQGACGCHTHQHRFKLRADAAVERKSQVLSEKAGCSGHRSAALGLRISRFHARWRRLGVRQSAAFAQKLLESECCGLARCLKFSRPLLGQRLPLLLLLLPNLPPGPHLCQLQVNALP